MEILMFETPVIKGDYIMDIGYKIDRTGSIYLHSKDRNAVDNWFRETLKPDNWVMIMGGVANPHGPLLDSSGQPYDYVLSLHRIFKGKGVTGSLGRYSSKYINF